MAKDYIHNKVYLKMTTFFKYHVFLLLCFAININQTTVGLF